MQFRFTRRAPWQVGSCGWGYGVRNSTETGLALVYADALTIACALRQSVDGNFGCSFKISIFDALDAALREVRNRDTRDGDYDFVIRKEDVLNGAMALGASCPS